MIVSAVLGAALAILAALAIFVELRRSSPTLVPPCLVCGAALEFVPEDPSSRRGVVHEGKRGWWLCSNRANHHFGG